MICINTRTDFQFDQTLHFDIYYFYFWIFLIVEFTHSIGCPCKYCTWIWQKYQNVTKGEIIHESLFTFWHNSADLTSIWRIFGPKYFQNLGYFSFFFGHFGCFLRTFEEDSLRKNLEFLTILIRAFQDIIMQQRMALSRICFQARFCKERKVCGRHRRRIFFSFWCLRMAKNEWTNVESKEKRGFLGFRKKESRVFSCKVLFPFLNALWHLFSFFGDNNNASLEFVQGSNDKCP